MIIFTENEFQLSTFSKLWNDALELLLEETYEKGRLNQYLGQILDASDNSVLKGAIQFQLPEYIGNEWMFSISYGEDLIGQNQIGLSVKYVPDFNSTLKKYYRNYSANIKSLFFN